MYVRVIWVFEVGVIIPVLQVFKKHPSTFLYQLLKC